MAIFGGIVDTGASLAKSGADTAVEAAKGAISLLGGIFGALFRAIDPEDAAGLIAGAEQLGKQALDGAGDVAKSAGHSFVNLGADAFKHGLPEAVKLADPTRSIV